MLIEKLTPLQPLAFKSLENGLKDQNPVFVKLWFEYFYGKPKQQIDHTTNGESVNLNPVSFVKSE